MLGFQGDMFTGVKIEDTNRKQYTIVNGKITQNDHRKMGQVFKIPEKKLESNKKTHLPASSKWPFDDSNGGHLKHPKKGHFSQERNCWSLMEV